jgi:hypothetical protein
MNIQLDEKLIQDTARESINKAITESLKRDSYEIQKAVSKTLVDSLVTEPILAQIASAVKGLDTEKIGQEILLEITQSLKNVVVMLVNEALVETVLKLKGVHNFQPHYQVEHGIVMKTITQTKAEEV